MAFFGLHWLDWLVLGGYFALVIYLGVFLGGQKTKNLSDFFVAGGSWGRWSRFCSCLRRRWPGTKRSW